MLVIGSHTAMFISQADVMHRQHVTPPSSFILQSLTPPPTNRKFSAQTRQVFHEKKSAWNAAKEGGMKLFLPEKGGSYEVFNDRPLAKKIIQYCVQDVQFLPRLWSHYQRRLSASWAIKVQVATDERVLMSQSEHYKGHGKHKALAPAGWYSPPARNIMWDDY
ncbi:predicted protein [Plenodomus lingam JN3]|uniref:Predicted protein n=1 Tax=Leptosphaeria maculans (strain JN3 / isolate v23.1.3 / race Av1-4-5-6-7-8) TaxID=985895 RepID=E4ZQU7_LEPMJ|nr:predicted protein [Plenodomus lingam JN3]CBX94102.1 predicted protein [Plenodomus lingam JN3]